MSDPVYQPDLTVIAEIRHIFEKSNLSTHEVMQILFYLSDCKIGHMLNKEKTDA